MNKTALITVSSRRPTESYYFLDKFETSCQRQNAQPIFIDCSPWCGLMTKPAAMLKWINQNGEHFDTIVFSDSWDVVLVGTMEEIVAKFESFDAPLVFNAERNCFPRTDLEPQYNPSATPYRFLNSGFVVGTPAGFLDMLNEMHLEQLGVDYQKPDGSWVNKNDQEFVSLWYLANQTKARLDHEGYIAQTLHGADLDEFAFDERAQRPYSKLTGNMPVAFHGNGGGKVWLEKIIRWMKL